MRLGEAKAREAHDLRVDALRHLTRGAPGDRALHELPLVRAHGGLRARAAHRPAQPLGLAGREAGERHRHLDHLVLEDDRSERVAQHRLERGVVVGDLVGRVRAQRLAPLDVGMDRAALDRAGTNERDLDGQVVERLGPGPLQHLHLRAALDLKDAHRLGGLDLRVHAPVVGDPGEVDPLAAHARDLVHAALHRREHPQAQQVDLQEARVRARLLVPLHHLAARHRSRLDRADLVQWLGGDDHPARVLAHVARQSPGVPYQTDERLPARRGGAPAPDRLAEVAVDVVRSERVGRAGRPLDLARR